jgi:hypothetical protein
MNFDGDNAPPTPPHNNTSMCPEPGTPGFDKWVAAENAARERAGAGINHQRLATLAADKAAAEKTRKELEASHV